MFHLHFKLFTIGQIKMDGWTVTRIKFMRTSKNEKCRSGRVTVMRFDTFGALKEIKNNFVRQG